MPRILITAFEPYGGWVANSSWLALVEFTKNLNPSTGVTTRLYPVDFDELDQRLRKDLEANYDVALHLGQAPGAPCVKLEAVGLNVGGRAEQRADEFRELVADGPVAYRSALPLADWSRQLRAAGIPAAVSYHAGSYLCNAALYLSHYYAERLRLKTQVAFLHLPLDFSQITQQNKELPAMSASMSGQALKLVVDQLTRPQPVRGPELA